MRYQTTTTIRSDTKDSKEQENNAETTTKLPGKTWTVLEEDGAFNVTLPLGFGKYFIKPICQVHTFLLFIIKRTSALNISLIFIRFLRYKCMFIQALSVKVNENFKLRTWSQEDKRSYIFCCSE